MIVAGGPIWCMPCGCLRCWVGGCGRAGDLQRGGSRAGGRRRDECRRRSCAMGHRGRLGRRACAHGCVGGVLVAEFLGERKLANLRKLIDQARSFDRSALFTLADFITQLGEFVAEQPKEALAATQPESTDAVKLMTIHGAKGLEFPLVAVP